MAFNGSVVSAAMMVIVGMMVPLEIISGKLDKVLDFIKHEQKGRRHMFNGELGKSMMIRQGYVPPTCTLPVEIAGPLIWSEINSGNDPCSGCEEDRKKCNGRSKKQISQKGP